MASEFDELIRSLQYELALSGDEGLSFEKIKKLSVDFFAPKNALVQETTIHNSQSLLFSDEPPRTQTVVDSKLVSTVWDWLLKQNDVHVKKVKTDSDVESTTHDNENGSEATTLHRNERLVTTTERLWQAVAGHGVDKNRVKAMEFTLLHIIAKHGPDGMIQPELVKESGQDKRSVPKRTDALVDGGYIIKRPVIAQAAKTSFLMLKRYEVAQENKNADSAPVPGGIAFYDHWYVELMKLLNKHNGVIATADLKVELGIKPSTWEVKALNRCLRRLCEAGLIRRIIAQVSGKNDKEVGSKAKSILLLREPSDIDRQIFMQKVDTATITEAQEEDGEESDVEESVPPRNDEEEVSLVSQWTPDMVIGNFIFAIAEEAGAQGITIMDLHRRSFGPSWRRPVDETLIRLCDAWKHSQPSHLRHLALIKDTANHARMTHFVYRTFAAYSEAVANGDAHWEHVQSKVEDTGLRHNQPAGFVQRPIVETQLDNWGFPTISQDLLAGDRDGTATLAECSEGVKDLATIYYDDEVLEVQRRKKLMNRTKSAKSVDKTPTTVLKRKLNAIDDERETSKRLKSAEESTASPFATVEQELRAENTASPASQTPKSSTEHVDDDSSHTSIDLPRVRINPPGAHELKLIHRPSRGRPRKSLIAVFKLERLKQLDWFVQDEQEPFNPLWRPKRRYLKRKREAILNKDASTVDRSRSQSEMPLSIQGDSPADRLKQIDVDRSDFDEHARENDPQEKTNGDAPDTFQGHLTIYDNAEQPPSQLQNERQQTPSVVQATPIRTEQIQQASNSQSLALAPVKFTKKGGITRHHGSAKLKRTQIVMEIIAKCGGVYPGNREIHPSMVTALQHAQGTTIDWATVDNTIKDLINRGKLRRIFFQFYDTEGKLQQRSILAEPSIAANDTKIQAMQENIEKHFPERYRPDVESETNKQSVDAPAEEEPPASQNHEAVPAAAPPEITLPAQKEVTVIRTAAGLQADEEYRQELMRKHDRHHPVKRRRLRVNKHIADRDVEASDDSDDEDDEPSPEQAQMMHSLQIERYENDTSHSFPTAEPRIRFPYTLRFKTLPTGHMLGTFLRKEPEIDPDPPSRSLRSRFQSILPAKTLDTQPAVSATTDVTSHAERDTDDLPQNSSGVTFAWQTDVQHLAPVSDVGQRYFPRLSGARPRSGKRSDQGSSSHVAILDMRQASKTAGQILGRLRVNKPSYNSLRGHRHALGLDKTVSTPKESSTQLRMHTEGPAYSTTKKRDRRGAQMFNENEKLVCGVALYRAVCGGVDQRNNWGVIAHMFSFRYEPDFLRRRWDVMKNAQETTVQNIVDQIQDSFLTAYSEGKVPSVDFENLNQTDWAAMLKWVDLIMTQPDMVAKRNVSDLPRSVEHLHDSFTVSKQTSFWEYSKESWFTSPVEKTRRDIAHEFVFGVALPGHSRPFAEPDPAHLVPKSLIRAIAATSVDDYLPQIAFEKLSAFDDDQISLVKDEMLNDKTLRHINKGRIHPGRNFEIHDSTWACFRRWPGKTNEWVYLREIASSRANILDHLAEHEEWSLQLHTSDTEVIVLMNMLSQGLLNITTQIPERNDDFEAPFPKLSALGYNGYTYNAKTLDRAKLRFPVAFEKTERFTAIDGLIRDVPVPLTPPADFNDGRIPFWIDINGKLIPTIWDLVLRSVLHLLVFRVGCTARHIEESHNHKILVWEINLLLQWMESSGIAVRIGCGEERGGFWTGGWSTSEWWYCAFMPDMISWR